ncbi:MAG TPA: mevalonate kinase [Kofleriaceae bacterium]|nr:mevalonate kinase [Kofleriaceae bacterium]
MEHNSVAAHRDGHGYGHGKLIILGEHSVVYGYPALAAALSCGVSMTASSANEVTDEDDADRERSGCHGSTEIADWRLAISAAEDHPVAVARRNLCASLGVAPWIERDLLVRGQASVPAGAGLGSSAAMAVAMARAIAAHCGLDASAEQICAAANASERTFHDTPSGVDVALAYHGGVGEFRRGAGLAPLQLPLLRIAVGVTGDQRNTKAMVQTVAAATASRADDPRLVELGQLASDGRSAWAERQWRSLGRCCDRAQALLAELGVATDRIELLCRTARAAGATGAKLTGAGGGGSVIAIADDADAVVAAWRAIGVYGFVATVGGNLPPEQL